MIYSPFKVSLYSGCLELSSQTNLGLLKEVNFSLEEKQMMYNWAVQLTACELHMCCKGPACDPHTPAATSPSASQQGRAACH